MTSCVRDLDELDLSCSEYGDELLADTSSLCLSEEEQSTCCSFCSATTQVDGEELLRTLRTEARSLVDAAYLHRSPALTPQHRRVLVSWMVTVCHLCGASSWLK